MCGCNDFACVQIYDLVLLLDCGWDERCSKELLSPLKDVSGHLDAVLLTHPDPLHLGALPVLVRPALGMNGYPTHFNALFLGPLVPRVLASGMRSLVA